MKLIGSLTSPYVRKVRIVMAEKKLDYRLEIENVWSADTQIQTYNPWARCLAWSWKTAALCSICASSSSTWTRFRPSPA